MRVCALLGLLGLCLIASSTARAVDEVTVVEDWTQQVVGSSGVPAGWKKYETPGGRPRYDFSVVGEEGVRGLRLRSRDEHSRSRRRFTSTFARRRSSSGAGRW